MCEQVDVCDEQSAQLWLTAGHGHRCPLPSKKRRTRFPQGLITAFLFDGFAMPPCSMALPTLARVKTLFPSSQLRLDGETPLILTFFLERPSSSSLAWSQAFLAPDVTCQRRQLHLSEVDIRFVCPSVFLALSRFAEVLSVCPVLISKVSGTFPSLPVSFVPCPVRRNLPQSPGQVFGKAGSTSRGAYAVV